MNRSFSKKRHILEANIMLEKKFLLEKTQQNSKLNLLEQTTNVDPKDPKWYEKFPCLKREVGMEFLNPKLSNDGKYYLDAQFGSYYPDGLLFGKGTRSFFYWYCKSDVYTDFTPDKEQPEYVSALARGWAIKNDEDLDAKPKPIPEPTNQEPKNPYDVKNLDAILPQGTGGRSNIPDQRTNVSLTTTSKGVEVVRDGLGRSWLLKDEKAVPLNMNDELSDKNEEVLYSYSSTDWNANDNYFNQMYEKGLNIYYKPADELYDRVTYPYVDLKEWGNPKLGTRKHNKMIEQFQNDLRKFAEKYGKFAIKIEDRVSLPDLFNSQTSSVTNNQNPQPEVSISTSPSPIAPEPPVTSVISDVSQNMGNTGVKSSESNMINLYNDVSKTGKLNQGQLQYCASILSNWYKDWQDEILYPEEDYKIFRKAAQSCVNQVNPTFFSSIFGERGGKVDRNTGKLIDILTRKGKSPVSAYSIYRLYKK